MTISKKALQGITLALLVVGATTLNGQITEAANEHQNHVGAPSICTPIIPYTEMTNAQKTEFKTRHETMLKWHTKDLREAVSMGKITQQDADARLVKIQDMFKGMQDGKMAMHKTAEHNQSSSQHDNHNNHNKQNEHKQHKQ